MKTTCLLFVLLLSACGQNYSDGSRVGIVTKLSHKGFIFKSWEGELNMGGVRSSSQVDSGGNVSRGVVSNVFEFNVDPKVADKVQAAMRSGDRVELVYQQWALAPWTIENDHVVIDVKPAE